jgi:hypothetical protein
MATLSASVSGRTVTWEISDLNYPFDNRQYSEAGITTEIFTDGVSSLNSSLIKDTISATIYVPPTYSSRLFEEGVPVTIWVEQTGYTGYSFSQSTGIYSYTGSEVTIQPSGSGTIYSISGGGTFLTKQVISGGLMTTSWYESYISDYGIQGETTIVDSYINADYGSYTIFGWAKHNGSYYNAGSYSITVLNDSIKIDISSNFTGSIPYIDTPTGWVIPEVWVDTPTGWVQLT